jgi:hypothetical protein
MDDVTIPGEPKPTQSPLIRTLTIVASGLTAASVAVNLILQITHHLNKRPVQPDQRTKLDTAALVLRVMKTSPPLIKQIRLFVSQLRGAA